MENESNTACFAASSGKYPPVTEQITIQWDIHPSLSQKDGTLYPFIRLDAIPTCFHAAIRDLSLGSTCPAPDDRHDSFYMHDIRRWLLALGVDATFVESK
jgi:hypothetical protein